MTVDHLAIGIAAYNDAKTIRSVIEESFAVLSSLTDSYSVYVINDGSRDNTLEIVENIAKNKQKLKVINHPVNCGFGKTILETYILPESEWVTFIPGDGQIPPSILRSLYACIHQNNFILGCRTNRQDSLLRKINSWCYNLLISAIAKRRVHDVNSSALIKRELLQKIHFVSRGAFIHAEIFINAIQAKASFCEILIDHKPRIHGEASGNKLSVILGTLQDLLSFFLKR